MSSAQIWEQIIQQIAQLQQSLQAYQQAVKLEHEEMSQCDKFDQDALHLLEFTALNAGESAHVMKQWRENRLYRRQLKQQIHFSQQALPFLQQLSATLQKPPLYSSQKQGYEIRSLRMQELANSLYEKGRLEREIFLPLKTPRQEKAVANEHDVTGQIRRVDNRWELVVDEDVVLSNKKLLKVIQYVLQENISVYAEAPHDQSVHNLLERYKSSLVRGNENGIV